MGVKRIGFSVFLVIILTFFLAGISAAESEIAYHSSKVLKQGDEWILEQGYAISVSKIQVEKAVSSGFKVNSPEPRT